MSYSSDARELAKLLRQLARWVEEHPSVFGKESKPKATSFEPFKVLSEEGEVSLRARLEKMRIAQLRSIIQTQRLDPAGQTTKWRDRRKLTDFAFERLRNVWAHGRVFEKDSAAPDSI